MEILALKYFCDAAELQSFSRTAEKYLVPTSSVSQVIKRLESELGGQLFDRCGNRITLNEDGKKYYNYVKEALSLLDGAKRALAESDGEVSGEISLLVDSNRRTVANAVEHFLIEHPRVSFTVKNGAPTRNACDLIISDKSPGVDYEAIPFVREKLLLAVSGNNPLAEAKIITEKELVRDRFIIMPETSSLTRITMGIFASLPFSPTVSIVCDDPSIIQRYVELGLGIAVIPSFSWKGVFSEKTVLRDIGEYYRTTYIFIKNGKKVPERVKLFIDELKKFGCS